MARCRLPTGWQRRSGVESGSVSGGRVAVGTPPGRGPSLPLRLWCRGRSCSWASFERSRGAGWAGGSHWRLGRDAAGAVGCGDYLRHRRRSGAAGTQTRPQGSAARRARRDADEGVPTFPVALPVGRTPDSVGRERDGAGRHRLPGFGAQVGVVIRTTSDSLQKANETLEDLRAGRFEGQPS
jgi:hypothetical protein